MATWKMAGGKAGDALTIEDYESLVTPLYELYYEVAQLPNGVAAQAALWDQLQGITNFLQAMSHGGKEVAHAVQWGVGKAVRTVRRRQQEEDPRSETETLGSTELEVLGFFQQVCDNLGWDGRRIVYAHTHQPLADAVLPGRDTHLYNTGSWFYDHQHAEDKRYMERAWPGTLIEIQEGGDGPATIQLRHLLQEYNPLLIAKEIGITERLRRTGGVPLIGGSGGGKPRRRRRRGA
jgi:hypothetical protein